MQSRCLRSGLSLLSLAFAALGGCRKPPPPYDPTEDLRAAEEVRSRLAEILAAVPPDAELRTSRPCDDEALGKGLSGPGLHVATIFDGSLRVATNGQTTKLKDEEKTWDTFLTDRSLRRIVDFPKIDASTAFDWAKLVGKRLRNESPLLGVVHLIHVSPAFQSIENFVSPDPSGRRGFESGTARGAVILFDYRGGGPRCWATVEAHNSEDLRATDFASASSQDLTANFTKAAREGISKVSKVARPAP